MACTVRSSSAPPSQTPFFVFVLLMERLSNAKAKKKREYMDQFFQPQRYGWGNFFPVYRLFLPKSLPRLSPISLSRSHTHRVPLRFDHERPTYQLKEKSIAKAYVELLAIEPKSDDGRRLLNFQVPASHVSSSCAHSRPPDTVGHQQKRRRLFQRRGAGTQGPVQGRGAQPHNLASQPLSGPLVQGSRHGGQEGGPGGVAQVHNA